MFGMPERTNPNESIRVENNHPSIVDPETFAEVQDLLRERAPDIVHPRTVNSSYLLGGFTYCGKYGSRMVGSAAKSWRFFYYACQNHAKRGKQVCDAGLVRKDALESFVIGRLRANILTEENLAQLARLTNEEIARAKDRYQEWLPGLDSNQQPPG